MVGWIWFAVILMGIGGLVALIPPRGVIPSEARDPLPAGDASPSSRLSMTPTQP
jgi:hypothetical protein